MSYGQHQTFCPMCGKVLAIIRMDLLEEYHFIEIDKRIKNHMSERHPRRYALWCRFGKRTSRPWRWLITRRSLWRSS